MGVQACMPTYSAMKCVRVCFPNQKTRRVDRVARARVVGEWALRPEGEGTRGNGFIVYTPGDSACCMQAPLSSIEACMPGLHAAFIFAEAGSDNSNPAKRTTATKDHL